MDSIRFENVSKSFGKVEVIKNLTLHVKKGERLILLGSSGCGKSTILRMISGLETITAGELYLNDELANDIDSGDRSIAMVFQNYALFPHMTIEENISYGLRINKIDSKEIKKRVTEAIQILNLNGLEKRLPKELSGGQRQRVALARALVKKSDFFLLDEPLSNLDAQLRGYARKELVKIHEIYRQTFVYVTHDQIEAMTIGNRIAILNEGNIQMLDTPGQVYHRPANIFVAKFIGSPSMNIIAVNQEANEILLNGKHIVLPEMWLRVVAKAKPSSLKLGIRPENIALSNTAAECSVPVKIQYVEDYGNRVGLYFNVNGVEVISIMPEKNVVTSSQEVYWNLAAERLHFFDGESGKSLGYPEELALK